MPLLQAVVISVIIPGAMLAALGFLVWRLLTLKNKQGLWARFAFIFPFQMLALWVGLTLYATTGPHPNRAQIDWVKVLVAGGSAGIGGVIGLAVKSLWSKHTADAQEKHPQQAEGKTDAD